MGNDQGYQSGTDELVLAVSLELAAKKWKVALHDGRTEVEAPIGAGLRVRIDARDVSIALSRPMDVSVTNRLPGAITEVTPLELPFVRVALNLGKTTLYALVTLESVDRLALEPGLRAWAMVKSVAIEEEFVNPLRLPRPRRWRAT